MVVLLAAVLAGAAVLALTPSPGRRLRPRSGQGRGRRRDLPRWRGPRGPMVILVTPVVLSAALLAPPAGVLALIGALAALLVVLRRRAAAASRAASELTSAVVDAVTSLASDLAAGYAPLASLAALAEESSRPPVTPARTELGRAIESVVGTARLGGDTAGGLRRCSAKPGARGLAAVAAAWEVAEATGAGLSPVLDQVAAGLRAQLAADRAVTVALAGARSTARLLAALPLLGLAMGAGLGVSPTGFLLGSLPGRLCLFLGLGLEILGLVWTDRLAEAAVRPAQS